LRQRIFRATVTHIESMRQMNHKNRAQHHRDEACGADSKKNAGQDGQPAANLRHSHQIGEHYRPLMGSRKLLRAGTIESSKEYAASVIKEGRSAGDPEG
jgi:hypothetical protein